MQSPLSRSAPVVLALILTACSPRPTVDTADAAPPAAASTATVVVDTAAPSAAPSAPPTAEPTSAPYLPPPGATDEDAPRKTIGTFDDWVSAYRGMGAPERDKRPPRLGLVRDLAIKTGRIAFTRSGDIFTFDLAAGVEAQLTRKAQRNLKPTFLADGKRLVFLSNRDGAWRVFSMNADGTDQRPISAAFKEHYYPSFAVSGDGGKVAYVAHESSDWPSARLHLVDVAGGRDEPVGELDDVEDAAFSPRGDELYYVGGGFDMQRLAVVDVATKRVRRLPQANGRMFDRPQRLGDRLLFSAGPTGAFCCRSSRVYTSALDGSDRQTLGPFSVPGSMNIAASPRGARLAVAWSMREGGFGADWRSDISILDANGTVIRPLTAAFPRPFYSASAPAWAPDERHVAFTLSLCPYVGCQPSMRSVVVVDVMKPDAVPAFIGYGGDASWSPVP